MAFYFDSDEITVFSTILLEIEVFFFKIRFLVPTKRFSPPYGIIRLIRTAQQRYFLKFNTIISGSPLNPPLNSFDR